MNPFSRSRKDKIAGDAASILQEATSPWSSNTKDVEGIPELSEDDVFGVDEEYSSDELTELYHSSDIKVLDKIGFKKANPGSDTYEGNKKDGPINILYGIPMRAGKWAGVWVGEYKNAAKGFFFADMAGEQRFAEIGDLMKELKKVALGEGMKFERENLLYSVTMKESSRSFRFDIFNALTGEWDGSWTLPNDADGTSISEKLDSDNSL